MGSVMLTVRQFMSMITGGHYVNIGWVTLSNNRKIHTTSS